MKFKHQNQPSSRLFAASLLGFLAATGSHGIAANNPSGTNAAILGGDNNTASGGNSAILGGIGNTASGAGASILGGQNNTATGQRAGILTGFNNTISGAGNTAAILGGSGNVASASSSGILTGSNNQNSGVASLLLTGSGSTLTGPGSVLGGSNSTLGASNSFMWARDIDHPSAPSGIVYLGDNSRGGAPLTEALSSNSMVCRFANGLQFFADSTSDDPHLLVDGGKLKGGRNCTMDASESFLWGNDINYSDEFATGIVYLSDNSREGTPENEDFAIDNRMFCRFANGYNFFTDDNANIGVTLTAGQTSWSALSSRTTKHQFEEVDTVEVLEKVAAMPMLRWTYKHDEKNTPYMGVMAEDLYEAFKLGQDEKRINTLVADGVQMAAIQGLNRKLENELKDKNAKIEELKASQQELADRLEKLESMMKVSRK